MEVLLQLLNEQGAMVAIVAAMMWYFYKSDTRRAEDLKEEREKTHVTMQSLVGAVNGLTVVCSKTLERVDDCRAAVKDNNGILQVIVEDKNE